MEGLADRDFRAAFEFIELAWALADERAFSDRTLVALNELIPSDVLSYSEVDEVNRAVIYNPVVGEDAEDGAGEELFWEIVEEHPLCRHQRAYLDFSANRLSDVISRRRLMNSLVYAEWFRPLDIAAELEIGVASSRTRSCTFILDRADGDFSARDRAVLELVRPHLQRIWEMSALRRAFAGVDAVEVSQLTPREAEIVELVAAGLTNAVIAERLWISPGTVKKHLENIYAKLGVANRTAVASKITARQRNR
jgi:DNA-binding CsgD family transcriptional regulator